VHKGCGYRRASDAAEWNLSAAWTAGYGDPLACARGRAHRARSRRSRLRSMVIAARPVTRTFPTVG